MRWPEGFIWGTAASSTQCEGAAPASDWWDFERAGHVPRSGDGNGFATRHAEDFRLLAGLGLTHHRLSIDAAALAVSSAFGHHERGRSHRPLQRTTSPTPETHRAALTATILCTRTAAGNVIPSTQNGFAERVR